jgi:hypothetical protein
VPALSYPNDIFFEAGESLLLWVDEDASLGVELAFTGGSTEKTIQKIRITTIELAVTLTKVIERVARIDEQLS